jgi:hypothetical protein
MSPVSTFFLGFIAGAITFLLVFHRVVRDTWQERRRSAPTSPSERTESAYEPGARMITLDDDDDPRWPSPSDSVRGIRLRE